MPTPQPPSTAGPPAPVGSRSFAVTSAALALALAAVVVAGCGKPAPAPQEGAARLKEAFPTENRPEAVQVAIAATESDDFGTGVIAIQAAKATPGLTAAQLGAMEEAAQAITSALVRRADAGDTAAQAQLQAIERSRSQ